MNTTKRYGEKMSDENPFDEPKEERDEVTYEDIKQFEEESDSVPIMETKEFEKQTGSSTRIGCINDLVNMLAYRARNGYDSVTAWCGMRNVGKSVGAQRVVSAFQEKLGHKYKLKRDTLFKNASLNDIVTNIKSKPLPRGIILDEAEKFFYRMDWQNAEQNELIKFLSFARVYRKHLFLLLPHFTDMRTSFRNSEITLWIQGIKQGFAVVFLQDTNLFEEDRWHMRENKKIWRRMSRGRNVLNPNTQLDILSHTVNYIGDFHFDDLDEEWKQEYLQCKLGAFNDNQEAEQPLGKIENKYRSAFYQTLPYFLEKGMKPKEIEAVTGIPSTTINNIMKRLKLRPEDKLPDILKAGDI